MRFNLLSATLPDTKVISYDHDAMGRRVAKKVNGTITEKYLWQDATMLLAVYDSSDNLLQRFEYADVRMPVAMAHYGSGYNGEVFYLAYDQIGSLRVVTDSTGTVVKRVDYDSFGNIISDSAPSFSIPFGFAGGLHDRSTGLVRFGARDYDPATGKWCAKDPIDFAGRDLNLGSYVEQDPVNWVDPDGLAAELILLDPAKEKILYAGAQAIQSPPGYYSVSGHGNRVWIRDQLTGDRLFPKDLAALIKADPNFKPDMTVRLFACNTGKDLGNGNQPFAQQLANELGTLVEAPDNLLWTSNKGPSAIAPKKTGGKGPDRDNLGTFRIFLPSSPK